MAGVAPRRFSGASTFESQQHRRRLARRAKRRRRQTNLRRASARAGREIISRATARLGWLPGSLACLPAPAASLCVGREAGAELWRRLASASTDAAAAARLAARRVCLRRTPAAGWRSLRFTSSHLASLTWPFAGAAADAGADSQAAAWRWLVPMCDWTVQERAGAFRARRQREWPAIRRAPAGCGCGGRTIAT